jgi:hypothetical protein
MQTQLALARDACRNFLAPVNTSRLYPYPTFELKNPLPLWWCGIFLPRHGLMGCALCFSFLQRDFRIKPAHNQKWAWLGLLGAVIVWRMLAKRVEDAGSAPPTSSTDKLSWKRCKYEGNQTNFV